MEIVLEKRCKCLIGKMVVFLEIINVGLILFIGYFLGGLGDVLNCLVK